MNGNDDSKLIFGQYRYHVSTSFTPQHVLELEEALDTYGAHKAAGNQGSLVERAVNLVITNSMKFEGWEDVIHKEDIAIVSDTWVSRSILLSKPQPPQFYSPLPSLVFSGITATCTTSVPPTDVEVLSAGVTAFGGQWRAGLTKDVTHLFAVNPDSTKYATAMHFKEQTGIKIILPHWFDDVVRLGTGSLPTEVYEWPDPPFLKGEVDYLKEKEKRGSEEKDVVKKNIYSTAVMYTQGMRENAPPSLPPNVSSVEHDAWKGRRIVLSRTLQLYRTRREAVQIGIERAGGVVVRFEGDDEEEEDKADGGSDKKIMGHLEKQRRLNEAEAIKDADVLVTRWRHGRSYVNALKGNKTIGTLAWLFHVQSTGILSRPMDQLLHYPIPRRPIDNFSKHVITLTNYTGEAREYLKKLVAAMGATFTPSMSGQNTVLIAAYLDGTKSTKAQSWSIPVVNHTWIEDCFVQWRNLTPALDKYLSYPPGVNFASILGERGVGVGLSYGSGERWLEEVGGEGAVFSEEEEDVEVEVEPEEKKTEERSQGEEEEEEMRAPIGTEASMKEVVGLVGLPSAPTPSRRTRGANTDVRDDPIESTSQPRPRQTPLKPMPKSTPKAATPREPLKPISPSHPISTSKSKAKSTRPRSPSPIPSLSSESLSFPSAILPAASSTLATGKRKLVRRVTVEIEKRNVTADVSGTPARAAADDEDDHHDEEDGKGRRKSLMNRLSNKGDARTRIKPRKSGEEGDGKRKRTLVESISDLDDDSDRGAKSKRTKPARGVRGRKLKSKGRETDLESEEADNESDEKPTPSPTKRPRGRPRKNLLPLSQPEDDEDEDEFDEDTHSRAKEATPKRPRGRPRKIQPEGSMASVAGSAKRPRGRPRKAASTPSTDAETENSGEPELEEEEEEAETKPRSGRPKRSTVAQATPSPTKVYGRRGRRSSQARRDMREESSSEEEEEVEMITGWTDLVTKGEESDTEEKEEEGRSRTRKGSKKSPTKKLFSKVGPIPTNKPPAKPDPVSKTKTDGLTSTSAAAAASPNTPKRTVSVLVPTSGLLRSKGKAKAKEQEQSKPKSKKVYHLETSEEEDRDEAVITPRTRARARAEEKGKKAVGRTESFQVVSGHQLHPPPSPQSSSTVAKPKAGPSSSKTSTKAKPSARQERVETTSSVTSSYAPSELPAVGSYSKRSAATKATQRLHETIMPDLVNFEAQMKKAKSRKSGGVADFVVVGDEGDNAKRGKKRPSTERGSDMEVNDEDAQEEEEEEEEEQPKKKKRKVSMDTSENGRKGKRKASEAVDEPASKKPKSTKGKAIKKVDDEFPEPVANINIMTTQVTLSEDVLKVLGKLGVKLTSRPSECTHLVAANLVRTEKFLCALANAPFVVTEKWALQSAATKRLLPENDFLLKDKAGESKYGVDLAQSLKRAKSNNGKLLQGHTFYVTPKVPVDRKLLKNVVHAYGGEVSHNSPTIRIINTDPDHRHVVSCKEDIALWRPLASQGIVVYNQELLLNGALGQEVEWERKDYMVQA